MNSVREQAGRTALLVKHLKGAALGLLVAYNASTFWDSVEGYCPKTGFPIYPGHGPVEVVRSCPAQELRFLYGVNVPAEAGVVLSLPKNYGRKG